MTALGLRCTNKGYIYAIVTGSKSSHKVLDRKTVPSPKGYAKPQALKWFLQELEDRVQTHGVDVIAVKGTEGLAPRGSLFVDRVHFEAVAHLVGGLHGLRVVQKVKSTIAKDLGFKGKARYLKAADTSAVPDFGQLPETAKEAFLVALSELP